MRIYRIAKKFTDLEQWVLHGVDPQSCRDEFKAKKQERAKLELVASVKAEELGHKLFQNWTPIMTNRCRKCGATIELHNVIDKTDAPNITGAAIMNKCNVNLICRDDIDDIFKASDEYLKDLNEPKSTTIL